MNISEAAAGSGVPAKTIRYYEAIGLIPAARRAGNGYRQYSRSDVHVLRFVNRARGLGFSVDDVGDLLALWRDKRRASRRVRAIAARHIAEIEAKILALEGMRGTLQHLVDRCQGDHRPDCPILEDLARTEDTRS